MTSEDNRPAGTPSMQSSDGGDGVTIQLDNMTDSVEPPQSLAKEHQKAGEKYSPSSLHGRRKSKTSGEIDFDLSLPGPPLIARLPTATSLTPVTPLRWKSSKRLDEKKSKSDHEIRPIEVVKEQVTNSNGVKEDLNEQDKAMAVSKVGRNGGGGDTKSSVNGSENSDGLPSEHKLLTLELGHNEGDDQSKSFEEVSPTDVEQGTDPSRTEAAGNDRKPPSGDEAAVITIEFLRARLLAERASSKAAREHVKQLNKKVLELEAKLEEEITLRRKADEATAEALLKMHSAAEIPAKETFETKNTSPEVLGELGNTSETIVSTSELESSESRKEPGSAHQEECSVHAHKEQNGFLVNGVDQKPSLSEFSKTSDLESRDLGSETLGLDSNKNGEQVKFCGTEIQNLNDDIQRQDVHEVSSVGPDVKATNNGSIHHTEEGLTQSERRPVAEERVRKMWEQMTEAMAALAENGTQKELVQGELLKWMGQVPLVLQGILPKSSEKKKLVIESSIENMPLGDRDGILADHSCQTQKRDKDGLRFLDGEAAAEAMKQDLANKKVASLIERYESQESVQRAWEQDYFIKQNSAGRRHSIEGSISRTNSDSGTPFSGGSEPESQQETSREGRIENSLSSERLSSEKFLYKRENITVDSHAPHFDSPHTYTYPTSTPVEKVFQPCKLHDGSYRSKEHPNGSTELGFERSFDPSFITPHLYSESSGLLPRSSRDLRSNGERAQILAENDDYYEQGSSRGGRNGDFVGDSGSSMEREELHKSQWDSPYLSPAIQQERMPPYSQAGHSNAYIRPNVPSTYPLQNGEREIYRGRLESVSRSMEGLGTSWRSSSNVDGWQGDEDSHYVERHELNEVGDSQNPLQARKSSPRPTKLHANNLVVRTNTEGFSRGESHVLYPDYDVLKDDPVERPASKLNTIKDSTSKVTDILRALHIAKLSIQRDSSPKTPHSPNTYTAASERSYHGIDKLHSPKTDYGGDRGRGPKLRSQGSSDWPHQEERRFSTSNLPQQGSPNLAGRSSPVSTRQSSFVDRMSVGDGIRFFYP